MSDALNLRQRLRLQTGQARLRHAEVEARTAARQNDPPGPGDLYVLDETARQGIEWAVLDSAPEGSRRLIVPADTNPLAGSADVVVPPEARRGPLTLRCAHCLWLAKGRLEPRLRAGTLESRYLEQALEKKRLSDEGSLADSASGQPVTSDPSYSKWVRDVIEPACRALSSSKPPETVPVETRPNVFFEGFHDDSQQTWRTLIPGSGLIVGQRSETDLVLRAERVSKPHAELFRRNNRHWIRDLGGASGTFVNRRRVTAAHPIRNGDVVRIGERELRYVVNGPGGFEPDDHWQLLPPPSRPLTELRLERLNKIVHFRARFQPLVRLDNHSPAGYELFGAGEFEGEQWQTPALFQVARDLGRETELVELREEGLSQAEHLPAGVPVLVSIHPDELAHQEQLTDSLRRLHARHPEKTLVIEIQEAGLPADRTALEDLSSRLYALGIDLAFKDFGGDQPRLEELIHVHPRFVKFGRGWTRDLHLASRSRRRMVEGLVRFMTDRGISTVAEGVDSEAQSRACCELGFELAQGSFFGSPVAAGVIAQGAGSPPPAEPAP